MNEDRRVANVRYKSLRPNEQEASPKTENTIRTEETKMPTIIRRRSGLRLDDGHREAARWTSQRLYMTLGKGEPSSLCYHIPDLRKGANGKSCNYLICTIDFERYDNFAVCSQLACHSSDGPRRPRL